MRKSKVYCFLFFISLVLFSSFSSYAKDHPLTQQEKWDTITDKVAHWTDGIGYPIDKEIREVVIALNAIGIQTSASCEGHFDHGLTYPWVDLEVCSQDVQISKARFWEKGEQIQVEESVLKAKYPNLSPQDRLQQPEAHYLLKLYEELNPLKDAYEKAVVNSLEMINNLLNLFYEYHFVTYDRVLILSDDFPRLKSMGADRQIVRSRDEQQIKLVEYREEMQAFAIFLKKKFMAGN